MYLRNNLIKHLEKGDLLENKTAPFLEKIEKEMKFFGKYCCENLINGGNFFIIKKVGAVYYYPFPSNKPTLFRKTFDLIITKGSKVVSKFFKINSSELNQSFRKKTNFNRTTDVFHFNLKKIGTIISFQQSSNNLKRFTSQHLVSICPVGKNSSGLVANLLPCCHVISDFTQKKLIDFFLAKVYEKGLIKCPCCQLSFSNNSEKKLKFD
mmetsp:Transcript_118724/g.177470  ORF Transcript_118724/g.177470 Transcript_118724/m.177470 type:complete len:209 (-) Transcript_118724:5-631(-)